MEGVPGGSSDAPGSLKGFSRKEIFVIAKKYLSKDLQVIIEHLEKSFTEKSGHGITIPLEMRPTISNLLTKLRSKYKEAAQRQDYFFTKNETWLNTIVFFPIDAKSATVNKSTGRPAGNFETLSDRSKRRRTEEIRKNFSVTELSFAAQMSLRSSGHSDAAKIVKDVTMSNPSKAKKYKEGLQSSPSSPASYDANEALALLFDLKLSQESYQHLRNGAKAKGLNTLYPPYAAVLRAKKDCYPPEASLTFTESKAEVRLQALLDHTLQRVLLLQRDDILHISDAEMSNMDFICKWGFDGTSGQSIYKMKFEDPNITDAHIFFTSLVPLQLAMINKETKEKNIIWTNPKPSSTLFCRPLKLEFTKETQETSLNEKAYYDRQIEQLQAHKACIRGKEVLIKYHLSMTMVDGKVCNASFSRKFSRVKTMEDVFRRLLATTDPYISSLRKPSPKKLKDLLPEAVALLVPVAEDYEDSGADEETDIEEEEK